MPLTGNAYYPANGETPAEYNAGFEANAAIIDANETGLTTKADATATQTALDDRYTKAESGDEFLMAGSSTQNKVVFSSNDPNTVRKTGYITKNTNCPNADEFFFIEEMYLDAGRVFQTASGYGGVSKGISYTRSSEDDGASWEAWITPVTTNAYVEGATVNNNESSEVTESRPVSWAYNHSINTASTPQQLTAFHGVDIFASVSEDNVGNLDDTSLFPFESKVHYSLSGVLKEMVGGFLEAGNRGVGTVETVLGLRVQSENKGTGNVTGLYGMRIDRPDNNGVVQNSYGIYIQDIRVATGSNYAILSDGGDVKFNGDLEIGDGGGISCELTEYADNAAAKIGGLTDNDFYRTGDIVKVVHS